jgi:hypothetical protein
MSTIVRALAVLLLPSRVADLIILANRIVASMTGNAYFPSPPRQLSDVVDDILALSLAATAAGTRTRGAVQARNVKRSVVISDLQALQAYVQQIADLDTGGEAEVIIQSAGMSVHKRTPRTKAPLEARQGGVSGMVLIIAKALAFRASYQWQWSSDKTSWSSLPPTLAARTSVSGLTAGTVYYFRFKGLLKTGETDWSQIVSLLVK